MRRTMAVLFLNALVLHSVSSQTVNKGLIAWWKFDKVVKARPEFETAMEILEKVIAEKTRVEILPTWREDEKKSHIKKT